LQTYVDNNENAVFSIVEGNKLL